MLCFSVAVRSVLLVAMSPLPSGHQPTTAQHFTSFSPPSASIDLRFGIWHLQFQKTATRRQSRLVPFGPKNDNTRLSVFLSYLIFAPLALYLTLPHFTLSYHLKRYLLLLIFFSDKYPMIPYLRGGGRTMFQLWRCFVESICRPG